MIDEPTTQTVDEAREEDAVVEDVLVEEVSIDGIRPERFGALLYHFGTRRLSFLKSPTLLAVVEGLAAHPSARAACLAAGVAEGGLPQYCAALTTLASSQMIGPRR
jgi:putative mycofactocin binding protein MftB